MWVKPPGYPRSLVFSTRGIPDDARWTQSGRCCPDYLPSDLASAAVSESSFGTGHPQIRSRDSVHCQPSGRCINRRSHLNCWHQVSLVELRPILVSEGIRRSGPTISGSFRMPMCSPVLSVLYVPLGVRQVRSKGHVSLHMPPCQ